MAATRRSARTASQSTAAIKQQPPIHGTTQAVAKSSRKRAASVSADSEDVAFKVPDVPSTPTNKRRRPTADTTPIAPPPITPTPSSVQFMAHTSSNPKRTPAKPRRAALNTTNAPLQTPGGTKVVKYPSDLFEASQGQASQDGEIRVTTEDLLEKACEHLCKVDPRLKPVIAQHHCKMFSPEGLAEVVEPFEALASGIISQQVSGAAASSIKAKFVSLFADTELAANTRRFPTPAQVIEKDLPTLRSAGLSQRKAEYISGLAEKFASGELSAQMLIEASDEEVLEKLIAVRGLGRWSVEMFACFGLKRTDIFSTGDLGVQRGMAAFTGKDVAKLKNKGGKWKYMSEADMLKFAEPFAPYRSIFMWYMWRVEDVKLDALE